MNNNKSIFFISISAFSFSVMAVFVKLANGIPLFEKLFFRNIITFLFTYLFLHKDKLHFINDRKNLKFLILRSSFGFIGVIFYFYAISNLYLADASVLNKLSPFFVTFFAVIFLGEKTRKIRYILLIAAFLSSLLIIKPKLDLSVIPALSGLLSAVFAGAAYTVVRFMHNKEGSTTIVMFFSLFSSIFFAMIMLFNFKVPSITNLIYLFGIGLAATGGQMGLTLAYKYSKASYISIFGYGGIIFSGLLGYFIWGEIPDLLSIIGIVLIFAIFVIFIMKKEKA